MLTVSGSLLLANLNKLDQKKHILAIFDEKRSNFEIKKKFSQKNNQTIQQRSSISNENNCTLSLQLNIILIIAKLNQVLAKILEIVNKTRVFTKL